MLRRILTSIHKRDWTAMLAELVLVVVGIFLGLQVDAWYEDRQLANSLSRYLDRLGEDVDEMLGFYGSRTTHYAEREAQALRSLRLLERCELPESARGEFELTLASHQVMSSFVVSRSTYDEMIAVGASALIDDRELKDALSGVFTKIDAAEDILPYFRADLGRASTIIWRNVTMSFDADAVPTVVEYDFDSLCNSREMRNALVEVVDSRGDWVFVANDILEALERLDGLLDRRMPPGAG